ncbi:MAG: type I-C CRISPR-associated protein Cas5 [Odoribacter sp.]|nr:type I-C CRISPR-associated protein Cas5 [Odoribacter sp.]
METLKNSIQFKVWGRYALFTDPITKLGGERCSYHIPTYEALKGVAKSIYWKPTLIWYIDKVRIMKTVRTQTKGTKPLKMSGGNDLSIYTYLVDIEYQVLAHFEWNIHRPELAKDRIDGKHFQITQRMLERGGRQDIFLGTRDCQGYVEPCNFGEGIGAYDDIDELSYGLMFHGFDYPDETGKDEMVTRFWRPVMKHGIIVFEHPEQCSVRKFVRTMQAKTFDEGQNFKNVEIEFEELILQPGMEDGKI